MTAPLTPARLEDAVLQEYERIYYAIRDCMKGTHDDVLEYLASSAIDNAVISDAAQDTLTDRRENEE
jgi:hypothetical protein